jgi:hypothetical protein
MTSDTTKIDCARLADEGVPLLFDHWFDPIESAVRARVRGFIEEPIENELEAVLARPRYGRRSKAVVDEAGTTGHRHGQRQRTLTGTFGKRPRSLDLISLTFGLGLGVAGHLSSGLLELAFACSAEPFTRSLSIAVVLCCSTSRCALCRDRDCCFSMRLDRVSFRGALNFALARSVCSDADHATPRVLGG